MFREGLHWIATVSILPLLGLYGIAKLVFGADAAVESTSQWIALVPGTVGVILRAAFFSCVLTQCDRTVFIGFGTLLSKADTRLGSHVYIGPFCQLGLVTIGQDTLIGPSVQIPSGPNAHTFSRVDTPIRNQPRESRRVTIGRDCWIGAGSVVMADVEDQCVIGAGSVVTKPIAARQLVAGVPCKMLKTRQAEI